MREILFRGKRVDNGKWVYGFLTKMWGQYHIVDLDDENVAYAVDEETVGQYTGLTDKNGTKIFEGDIVHYVYEPGDGYWNSNENGIIKFKSTGFYLDCISGTNLYASVSGWLISIPHSNGAFFEVIGNIHEEM